MCTFSLDGRRHSSSKAKVFHRMSGLAPHPCVMLNPHFGLVMSYATIWSYAASVGLPTPGFGLE